MKKVELKIVATGHKLDVNDSLMVLVHPQWSAWLDDIHTALEELTGHHKHLVLPIPQKDIKIFSLKRPITLEMSELKMPTPEVK